MQNVPPFEVWVGNPARFLRKIESSLNERQEGADVLCGEQVEHVV